MLQGQHSLRRGSTLVRLRDVYGKKRNPAALPWLSHKQILAWADTHYRRTAAWPNTHNGMGTEAPDEHCDRLGDALRVRNRGLPRGSLLVRKRGTRSRGNNSDDREKRELSAENLQEQ